MDKNKLDQVVANAQKNKLQREAGYREKTLKLYSWICGRCSREFTRANLQELTVHHRNHDHDYNPEDGSNWELLCVYCHDNEHQRLLDGEGTNNTDGAAGQVGTHNPFAGLSDMLKPKDKGSRKN